MKLQMLLQLKEQAEIVIVISAEDIISSKVRGDATGGCPASAASTAVSGIPCSSCKSIGTSSHRHGDIGACLEGNRPRQTVLRVLRGSQLALKLYD